MVVLPCCVVLAAPPPHNVLLSLEPLSLSAITAIDAVPLFRMFVKFGGMESVFSSAWLTPPQTHHVSGLSNAKENS